MTASLYIHIPFCVSHCDYCDFYSEVVPSRGRGASDLIDRFTHLLCTELDIVLDRYALDMVPTLYIGGGTPSVLGRNGLAKLLDHLASGMNRWPDEVTVEANPESVDESLFIMLKDRGVHRLSLGIQSLQEAPRRAVNRSGTVVQCFAALELAERLFPEAFSVDLMAGLPFQTQAGLCKDIDHILAAGATHVSLYSLILEETTPLARNVRSGKIPLPPEEEAEEIWLAGRAALTRKGLFPYEVSNFAKPGYESRHNMRYWRMENWIGCGPGASSTIITETTGTGIRYTNRPNLEAYLSWSGEGFPAWDEEVLDRDTLLKESLMMGFRTIYGPDEQLFEGRFHQSIESLIPETLRIWEHQGFLQDRRLALNSEGLLLLNSFLVDCFQELESRGH
jgi:oxygen-independent coproporphyrinogen-3 oxidase